MSYYQSNTPVFDYRSLIFYHLMVISRASASLTQNNDLNYERGQDPVKTFYYSVVTLKAFLYPYGTQEFRDLVSDKNLPQGSFPAAIYMLEKCLELIDEVFSLVLPDIEAIDEIVIQKQKEKQLKKE